MTISLVIGSLELGRTPLLLPTASLSFRRSISTPARYLHERRAALGGYLPARRVQVGGVDLPGNEVYDELKQGSRGHEVATTMAFVRMLKDLLAHEYLGRRIVPIIPDEARTFGMDSLFPKQKIYGEPVTTFSTSRLLIPT